MAVVAVTSAKGSPGVTVTCLALAWVWPAAFPGRQVLVVDADPAGSGIAHGYLRGEPQRVGTVGLAGTHHLTGDDVWRQLVGLDSDRWLLLGPTRPAQAAAVEPVWQRLATLLATPLTWKDSAPVDVILDLGRLGSQHEVDALRQAADIILIGLRSSLASVAAAGAAISRLASDGHRVRPLLIGDGRPYRRSEIAMALKRDVLGPLAFDPAAAAVFSEGTSAGASLRRSPLLRSARQLVGSLADLVQPAEVDAHA